jgi:hypothetical protein
MFGLVGTRDLKIPFEAESSPRIFELRGHDEVVIGERHRSTQQFKPPTNILLLIM